MVSWLGVLAAFAPLAAALAAGSALAQLGPALTGRVARADNAAVVNHNPAGITRVEGTQVVLDASLAYSFSEFKVGSGTTVDGGNPDDDDTPTLIPTLSASHRLTERFWIGLGMFFPAGIGTDYGNTWAGRYYATESRLFFLSIQPVLAARVTDWLSLGAGPAITYVDTMSKSAINNLMPGLGDGRLKIELDGVEVGAVVSALLEPRPGTRFGFSYRSEQDTDLSGRPRFRNLGPLLEAALDAAGVLGSKIDLKLKVPQMVQGGFYHRLNERISVVGDVGWIDWSRFGKVDLTVSDNSISVNQNYDDIWIGSFGGEYRIRENLSASAGFSYISSAVDDKNRTLSLPFDEIFLFGIGAGFQARPSLGIQTNLMGAITGKGRIDQQTNPLAGRVVGKSEDNFALMIQLAVVWGTKPR